MANKMVAVRPADLNPDVIAYFPVGSLLVNKLEGDLYIVIEENSKKVARLVGGAAKYEIARHMSLSHVISNIEPSKFDYHTMWYNTTMMYVEPTKAQEAYITVRAELSPGVFGWKTILPISRAEQVIISKNSDGTPYTLRNYIDELEKQLVSPPTEITEAESGEIYIKKGENTLWWKTGPRPEDQKILGDANSYLIERMKKSIHLGTNHPIDWDPNSLWLSNSDDANIVDAMTTTFRTSKVDFVGGFKWNTSNTKVSSAVTNLQKKLTIDLNTTMEDGYVLGNFDFSGTDKKYYAEFYIEDPQDKLQLVFFKTNPPEDMNRYGTHLDWSSMLIDSKRKLVADNETRQDFNWHQKTIFLQVDKTDNRIGLGYVLDDGTLSYVYNINNNVYNMRYMGIASATSNKANEKASIEVRPYKIKEIPANYTAINNILPGEDAFNTIVPATNANAVFISRNTTLNALHAGSGRLITTPRDYSNKEESLGGELMIDFIGEKLYGKKPDGSIFIVGGGNDDTFKKHLSNSWRVVEDNGYSKFSYKEEDPSRLYLHKTPVNTFFDNTRNRRPWMAGVLAGIDNSETGEPGIYKMIYPYTDTTLVSHAWNDFENNAEVLGSTKQYLDTIDKMIRDNLKTKVIYKGHRELFNVGDIVNRFHTASLLHNELKMNIARYSKDSIYIQPMRRLGASISRTEDYNDLMKLYEIFNVPEEGNLIIYKDDRYKVYYELITESGNKYTGLIQANSNGTPLYVWKKHISELEGNIYTSANINTQGNISAVQGLFTGKITNNGVIETSGNLSLYKKSGPDTVKYITTTNDTITIGDKDHTRSYTLESTDKPVWVSKLANGQTQTQKFAMESDITRAWNFISLLDENPTLNLDTLFGDTSVGYYLNSNNFEVSSNLGYPITANVKYAYLHVAKNDVGYTQYLVLLARDGFVTTYIRNRDSNSWSSWSKGIDKTLFDGKYDKTGGVISGNVDILSNLDVKGNTNINGTFKLKEASGITISGSDNNIVSITNTQEDTRQVKSLILGDKAHTRIRFNSSLVPQWITSTRDGSTVYKNIALAEDVEKLDEETYSKTEVDELIKAIDFEPIKREIKGKLSKTGDIGTGDYTFREGSVTIDNLNLLAGKVSMPHIKIPISELSITQGFASDKFNNMIKRYVLLGEKFNLNLLTFSHSETAGSNMSYVNFGLPTSENTSNILFGADHSNSRYFIGTVQGGNRNTYIQNRLLTENELVKDTNNDSTTKPLAANVAKILDSLMETKVRGLLSNFINTTVYNKAELLKLPTGTFILNSDADLVRINIDKNKVPANTGLLVVAKDTGNDNKMINLMYLPHTHGAQNTNGFAMANHKIDEPGEFNWIYVKDESYFYNKESVNEKLQALRNSTLSFFVSNKYSYTGNGKNIALPYRLIHTHNHNGSVSDMNSIIKFKTNINLSDTGLKTTNSLINIKISGYNEGDNAPVEIIASVYITGNSTNFTIDNNKSTVLYLNPTSLVFDTEVIGNFLYFTLKSDRGHANLSFDTFIRISRTQNFIFEPAVLAYRLGNGNDLDVVLPNLDATTDGLFTD